MQMWTAVSIVLLPCMMQYCIQTSTDKKTVQEQALRAQRYQLVNGINSATEWPATARSFADALYQTQGIKTLILYEELSAAAAL